jgi:hypothetical protein
VVRRIAGGLALGLALVALPSTGVAYAVGTAPQSPLVITNTTLTGTVGTPITPNLAKDLRARGIKEVMVNKRLPQVEFVMKPFTMNPLLETDWMARLSHRYLKGSIQQAVHFGEVADIHGAHPVPAYAYGAELRNGPSGNY